MSSSSLVFLLSPTPPCTLSFHPRVRPWLPEHLRRRACPWLPEHLLTLRRSSSSSSRRLGASRVPLPPRAGTEQGQPRAPPPPHASSEIRPRVPPPPSRRLGVGPAVRTSAAATLARSAGSGRLRRRTPTGWPPKRSSSPHTGCKGLYCECIARQRK